MPYQKPSQNCPICERKRGFKFIQDFKRLDSKFSLYQCLECQTQFWMPFKNPGANLYEALHRITILDRIKGGRRLIWWHEEFIKLFKNKNNQGKKLLDIGCGTGEFLNAAKNLGLDVFGVDFDRNAIKSAKSFYNLKNLYAESWEKFSQRKNLPKFDVITFFEVIEHLDDVPKFLRFVFDVASPNAFIALSTPNRQRKSLSADFSDDFPLCHLTRWDYSSLFKVFNFYGIKIENKIYGGDVEHFINTCFRFNIGRKITNFSQYLIENKNNPSSFFLKIPNYFLHSRFYHNLALAKNALFTPVARFILKFKRIFNLNPLKEEEKPFFLLIGRVEKQ